ncbi:hypothetical protein C5C52_01470 [Rathayibacter sp. AY1E5]|uniref:hypothetical protein n=1 Tax=Rathayibacter sp. AY1E5 TaxID=2080553 RepID=UPI000CE7754C|nr:hypothetical protein [Rathayibacter sp. AY1E5]PPG84234.1 hypothetical protein C5C52_01470 [Rathayibacter sp. AY1E5]
MATTIFKGQDVIRPLLVLGFGSDREMRSITHTIIGKDEAVVTYRAPGLRTGTLSLLFATLAEAQRCEAVHGTPGVLLLSDPEVPGIEFGYIPVGTARLELDSGSRRAWTFTVDYVEQTGI